jgi:hypothetical protein
MTAWLVQAFADNAALPGDPYATVVARNIFGLNPPPPPTPPTPSDPPPKIVPNGIMSILGQLQVLFKVPATAKPKPGEPAIDQSYILSEGQRQDDIEVVKIDEASGVITFNNHGETQVLPLVVTQPSATPVAAATVAPGGAPGGGPGTRFTPGLVNPGGAVGPGGSFRPGGVGSGSGAANSLNQGGNAALGNVPIRAKTFNAASQVPEGLTEDVQTIAIEATRLQAQEQGDPIQMILPITDLTQELNPGTGTAPSK